jgi:hypothetical protein
MGGGKRIALALSMKGGFKNGKEKIINTFNQYLRVFDDISDTFHPN